MSILKFGVLVGFDHFLRVPRQPVLCGFIRLGWLLVYCLTHGRAGFHKKSRFCLVWLCKFWYIAP